MIVVLIHSCFYIVDVEFPVLVIPGYTKIPGEKQNKRRTFSDDTKASFYMVLSI